jgi:hypothetical protein
MRIMRWLVMWESAMDRIANPVLAAMSQNVPMDNPRMYGLDLFG